MRMGEDNKQGEEVLLETMIFFFLFFFFVSPRERVDAQLPNSPSID